MSFLYSLPTTGAIKFSSIVSDPTNAHAGDLARASAARSRVRAVLKETRRAQASNKDWTGCATALQDYVPHLLAIIRCTENDSLLVRGIPVFDWRSTLSTTNAKLGRVSMPSFHYELVFVLLTYALALSNSATHIVHSVGQYERDAGTPEPERKRCDEQINSAADTLCRAAGVLRYLSENVIPEWEASGNDIKGRPPETTREVTSALGKICLADAEKLAIRRLLSKSVNMAEATIRPGPPLARGHPSPSLLSKLYLNVYTQYDAARSLGKSVSNSGGIGSSDGIASRGLGGKASTLLNMRKDRQVSSNSSTDEASEGISQDLRTYLSDGRAFSSALSYKWLGVDAGENGNKIGEAIAWLEMARSGVTGLQGKGRISLPGRNKGKVERAKRKDRLVEELEDIDAFLKGYKRTNGTVLFQPIPAEATLLSQTPAGRSALAQRPYILPVPAFASRRTADLEASDAALAAQAAAFNLREGEDSDSDVSEIDQPHAQSNYF